MKVSDVRRKKILLLLCELEKASPERSEQLAKEIIKLKKASDEDILLESRNNEISRIRIIVSYMREIGWFKDKVFVVWLNGCTDGWPRAIFNCKEDAYEWIDNIYLNPEGFSIDEVDWSTLALFASGCEDIVEW